MNNNKPLEAKRVTQIYMAGEPADAVTLHEITTVAQSGSDFETAGYAFTQEDATLFAAAPELLEVLQFILGVDDPDKVITANWSAEDWRNAKRQYNEAIKEVITKAIQSPSLSTPVPEA